MKYDKNEIIDNILSSRGNLPRENRASQKSAEEGGCGVTGFIASIPVGGRHIFEPSVQMHNRGNGKGGGIAAVGLCADDLGVPPEVLDSHYLLQIALLEEGSLPEIEKSSISPYLDIHRDERLATIDDYRDLEGLDVKPPDVHRYFVRVKPDILDKFISENGLKNMDPRKAEDEFIYQNSYKLNQQFYSAMGKQKGFVLSHGRNIMILKIVGYAEQVAQYYKLDDFRAHGWIAHQRYPTKGRVWHPGGAHPFCGLNEALVHNGDFANYHAVSEYLKQNNIYPQFLTDTEVSVLMFDYLNRTLEYPLEYIIEAIAPTTEHDFDLLPKDKQRIYRYIQSGHIHGSPDGPWFFIIARNNPEKDNIQLIGITDTAMLRPQVFAYQDGEVQIGLLCSEKQAIDATLQSLASEDSRFCPIADKYWNSRGGSAADGGAFIFTVQDAGKGDGTKEIVCTNKFGDVINLPEGQEHYRVEVQTPKAGDTTEIIGQIKSLSIETVPTIIDECVRNLSVWDYGSFKTVCGSLVKQAMESDDNRTATIKILTALNDRRYSTGSKKRSSVLQIINETLKDIFTSIPKINQNSQSRFRFIDWETRNRVRAPQDVEKTLVINAFDFPPEGEECDARLIVDAYELGWKQFICYGYKGQRFTGCGLGSNTEDVRIDVFDSSGDYLASGIDGMEIRVHDNAQDQLGQIMKSGKLVVYGDVGQTFMYGAKGGEVYVMGNGAGRPLINAVGRPRVVINGTCLDYLAESFMAGDPLNGGGFVILNGVEFDHEGKINPMENPYPGSNLFSLASGGAIYFRDPKNKVVDEQLNGGEFTGLGPEDWKLILPYLKENERLFGISIDDDLLTVDGVLKDYKDVYRKVQAVKHEVLERESEAEEYGEDWQDLEARV